LPPQQQAHIRQRAQNWDRMTPQQRQDMREREQVWQRMTPDQRQHVRNDVMPKWQQLPPDRRQAIQQRLRVLQNMPERARNQRLDDPNFTRGMSAEDKAMLRDPSNLPAGGPPDAPNSPSVTVALDLCLLVRLTKSTALVGVFGVANQIPILLLAYVGGYVGDRYNRHRGVIWTQTAAMILAFLLAALTLTGAIHDSRGAWVIIFIAFL